MKKTDLTWHDVLIKKGIEPKISQSLIGFISWNKNEQFPKLGKEITEILWGYEGKVSVKDVVSNHYNDMGLLFLRDNIPEDMPNKIFDIITSYEQEEVYNNIIL